MLEFAPQSANTMRYEEALLYCSFLDYNEHNDWRLPTYIEWSHHADIGWVWYVGCNWDVQALVRPVRDKCG
jgi:hypothetical protein